MDKEIKRLLASKLNKMEDLYKYTQNISDTLEKQDTEELLKILNNRLRVMEDIDSIDGELLSFFEGDINALTKYIINGGCELKESYNNIAASIKKIQEIDDRNLTSARELFSNLKEDIGNLRQAENALKGYGIIGKSSRDGAFIDTKK